MSTTGKLPIKLEEAGHGILPPPELLDRFAHYGPKVPELTLQMWSAAHQRAYRFARVSLVIGGGLAALLLAAFVYLVMHGHDKTALALLGGGAVSLVAGFRSTRL